MSALITDRVRNIEREVRRTFTDRYLQKFFILRLRQMLRKIHMQRRAAVETIRIHPAMQPELLQNVARFIFYDVEIRIITIARHEVAVALVPFRILYTEIFCLSVTFMTNQYSQGKWLAEMVLPRVSLHSTIPLHVTMQSRLSHTLSGLPHLVVQAAITLAPCCLFSESFKSIRGSLLCPQKRLGTYSVLNMTSFVFAALFDSKIGSSTACTNAR